MVVRAVAAATAVALTLGLGAGPARAECRLALALAFDVSRSVSARDYRIQRDGLLADQERLRTERDLLYRELGSWRERVAFMEKTAGWRWRERWIRLTRG